MATIKLDRERTICFDFNALALFEEATGRNLMESGGWEKFSAKDIRALLWAGLRRDDSALTIEQVGALMHANNVGEIRVAIEGAITAAMPEKAADPLPSSV